MFKRYSFLLSLLIFWGIAFLLSCQRHEEPLLTEIVPTITEVASIQPTQTISPTVTKLTSKLPSRCNSREVNKLPPDEKLGLIFLQDHLLIRQKIGLEREVLELPHGYNYQAISQDGQWVILSQRKDTTNQLFFRSWSVPTLIPFGEWESLGNVRRGDEGVEILGYERQVGAIPMARFDTSRRETLSIPRFSRRARLYSWFVNRKNQDMFVMYEGEGPREGFDEEGDGWIMFDTATTLYFPIFPWLNSYTAKDEIDQKDHTVISFDKENDQFGIANLYGNNLDYTFGLDYEVSFDPNLSYDKLMSRIPVPTLPNGMEWTVSILGNNLIFMRSTADWNSLISQKLDRTYFLLFNPQTEEKRILCVDLPPLDFPTVVSPDGRYIVKNYYFEGENGGLGAFDKTVVFDLVEEHYMFLDFEVSGWFMDSMTDPSDVPHP